MRKKVFLFDLDGVLVEPNGYRAALKATLADFYAQLGLPVHLVADDQTYASFEAARITSEWDMAPLCLATALEALLAANPGLALPQQVAALRATPGLRIPPELDYHTLIEQLKPYIRPGAAPAHIALDLVHDGKGLATPLFPHLRLTPLLDAVLGETHQVERSAMTRRFQHYTLGSRAFEQTYGLKAEVESVSLLQQEDRPLLQPALRQAVLDAWQAEQLSVTAYTLRPSFAPREAGRLPGYAPEAELALELVGLQALPRIGFGHMDYLARQIGADPDSLIKPAPQQALAAIFAAALSSPEKVQELAALNLALQTPLDVGWLPGDGLEVHIFEDSAGGIEAVRSAGQMLAAAGVPTQVRAWGVARHPEKVQALDRIGVTVVPDVNTALQAALAS